MDDDTNQSFTDEEEEEWKSEGWEELSDEERNGQDPEKMKKELAEEYKRGNEDAALSRAQDLGYNLEDLPLTN